MNKRQQKGGQGSENYQAGRDIVINSGISVREVYVLAREIVQDQLMELREEARAVASARAEELIAEFIEKVQGQNGQLEAIREPEVQYALISAQREYARSGREFHRRMLTNLLAAKCQEGVGNLEDVVLSEAIETVRKLSRRQTSTLSVNWLLRWVKATDIHTHKDLANWIESNVSPFLDAVATSTADYKHIDYCGCGSVSVGSITLPLIISIHYPGLFQRGLDPGQIPDSLGSYPTGPPLFTECLNDSTKQQVTAIDEEVARTLAVEHGYGEHAEAYATLLKNNILGHPEIESIMKPLTPSWDKLRDLAAKTSLLSLDPTSVGMAVAHSNWADATNNTDTPLSIWISDSAGY